MGPTLMNCCKPEQAGTEEHSKMLKQKDHKETVQEIVEFMAQKGLWNVAREKMSQDRGALPKEEGDIVREYKATHDERKKKAQRAKGR